MNTQPDTAAFPTDRQQPSYRSGSKDFEDFIYLLSHDVRGSVRALLEVPQWITEDLIADGHKISGDLESNIKLMNTHTQRLDRMLIDLLVYSRVGRNQAVSIVTLHDALNTVLEEVKIPNGFEVEADFKCSALLFGERDILTLFTALISNSIKHHHRSNGLIRVSSAEKDGHCIMHVSDDGPGIPDKHKSRIFDAMTTLRPRDEIEGSGMGLAIVRKIVHLYDGDLACISDQEQPGTTIEIKIPQDSRLRT